MKRNEIWLGAFFGAAIGILVGFFFGRSLQGGGATSKPAREVGKFLPMGTDSTERNASGSSADGWIKRYTDRFQNVPQNQPTPGLTEAMGGALQADEPFATARMLLLIEMMRKEDFPIALQFLRNAKIQINRNSMGGGPPMWVAFWQRFGERDPTTALAMAFECGDLNYADRNQLEKHLFTGMARSNPSAAAAAFLAHPDLPNRNRAAEGLIFEWAKTDAQAASRWAHQNLEGDALRSAFYAAAWGVSNNFDISGGNTFVKNLPEGPERTGALTSVKSQISNKPYLPSQQILDFVGITRDLGARDREFESRIAARCAGSDPYAAANFFLQPAIGSEPNDFAELRIVVGQWIRQDPQAAENWAKGQESAPSFEAVAGEFARAAQEQNDEAGARRWLEAIAAQQKGELQR